MICKTLTAGDCFIIVSNLFVSIVNAANKMIPVLPDSAVFMLAHTMPQEDSEMLQDKQGRRRLGSETLE